MNFDRSPIAPLAPGAELMGERIRSYLESRGYEVVTPPMSTTLALWKECTKSVGGIADESGKKLDRERYARAQSELVRRTLESFPADGAVSAAILVREGRYNGNSLSWDGVIRQVRLDVGETNIAVLQERNWAPRCARRSSTGRAGTSSREPRDSKSCVVFA